MEFLIGFLGTIWIAYRLLGERSSAKRIQRAEESDRKTDENRMNAWLARVVNNDVEEELIRLCGKKDPEIVKEVSDLEKFYHRVFYVTDAPDRITGLRGGDTVDALLANRGLLREKYARFGFYLPGKRKADLAFSLNENLKLRGVNEQLYVTSCDPSEPIRKVEEIGTGSDRLIGIKKIEWFPQLNYLERMCSDNAKRNRGESGWTFNDYIGW